MNVRRSLESRDWSRESGVTSRLSGPDFRRFQDCNFQVRLPSQKRIRDSRLFHRLNYFNYFTEVEDAFVRRRAKHLFLSPMDWALIESWKELGIPLHIVLRGIEKAFDSWEAKPRKRSVK